MNVEAETLASKLKRNIEGEVRFDPGGRALYATDGSNYRQTPIGVVIPRSLDDVRTTVALCQQFGAPITSRGCGTSLAGQCCNVAVIIDFSKYLNRVLQVDPDNKIATVQPGCVCDHLRNAAEKFQLTFGPDPATHAWCTLGGMLGNNSCGVHSEMAGRTADNVEWLRILTYSGEEMVVGKTPPEKFAHIQQTGGSQAQIYTRLRELSQKYGKLVQERFPRIPRRVSGYNLDELLPERNFHVARSLVGSEGTCVVILEAGLRLVHSPPSRALLVISYPDIFSAADHIMEVRQCQPIGLEGVDKVFIHDLRKKGLQLANLALFPPGEAYLLAEFGGETQAEAAEEARKCMARLKRHPHAPPMKIFKDPGKEKRIWHVRESGLGATAHVPGKAENWEGWEDSAVAPEKVGGYLRELKKLFDRYGYEGSLYGHFGQGCIHTRINFDLKTAGGVKKFRSFLDEATTLVTQFGGSLSGEHGDGQSRAEFLIKMFGPELINAFHEFKTIWDPQWKMNPGKIVKPYKVDENLRYGAHYNPPEPATHFQYESDGFSFKKAMERCVGVGKCRRHDEGTMCPSYQVTGEEMHSTRGRARLLFEMLDGKVLKDGWKSEPVKEALDLCLACKGCKGECPVHVDMATYKAEFLSHYYDGFQHWRPRHAYAFGFINRWASLASHFPRLANFVSENSVLGGAMKLAIGIEQERRIPQFARQSFQKWFIERELHPRKNRVVLWPDTFNNFFHPHKAQAAVEVLEDAGFQVIVPRSNVCCGRPLYDYGFLDSAKKYLQNVLRVMAAEIEAGLPFVLLEPSCCSVFRDELVNMLPHNNDAKRLKEQTFTLAEFLIKKAPNYRMPLIKRDALAHAHCHHKSVLKTKCDEEVLRRIGLKVESPDSGCCGMAGAFGFEKGEHYKISIQCGERVLLPAVRKAGVDQLILTDGFSCHEQILQQTGKESLHLAEVLQMALKTGKREAPPRQNVEQKDSSRDGHHRFGWLAPVGAAALATAVVAIVAGEWRGQ